MNELHQYIKKGQQKNTIDCFGFLIPDDFIIKYNIEKPINFTNATFFGKVIFESMQFKHNVIFESAKFHRDVTFHKVKFKKQLLFNDAIFSGKVTFSGGKEEIKGLFNFINIY